jgi:2'-5' RNA ligase
VQTVCREYTDIKWVKPQAIHITVVFLGDLDETQLRQCIGLLTNPALNRKSFTVRYKGAGQFPPKGKPRVLYIPIEQGFSECVEVYSILSSLLPPSISVEKRRYTPHLTLGRVRKGSRIPPPELFKDLEGEFVVNRCVLYESILKPGGAEYREVAAADFE